MELALLSVIQALVGLTQFFVGVLDFILKSVALGLLRVGFEFAFFFFQFFDVILDVANFFLLLVHPLRHRRVITGLTLGSGARCRASGRR